MSVCLGARPPEARLMAVLTVLTVECEFNSETPSCVLAGPLQWLCRAVSIFLEGSFLSGTQVA